MNSKLATILNLKPVTQGNQVTEEQIIDTVTALQKQVSDFQAQQEQAEADEKLIAEKIQKGLSRDQAIGVLQKNREFRASRFAQIGDAKKIKALFSDATAEEVNKAIGPKK
jgi:predicted DNA-binding WGR domain protein